MRKSFFICLSVLLAGAIAYGQVNTARLTGTVMDTSGAVVVGAKVTAVNPETHFALTTQSNSTGNYMIPNLPPGSYELKIEAQNFATALQKNVGLLVGQTLTLNFTLKPGTKAEVVDVTSETPLVETASSQVVGSVSPTEAKELPLLQRNFADLMSLVPGVRQAQSFDPTKTRSGNVSINGSDGRAVDYNVDGADNKDSVIGGLVQNYTMEGIQEFNVITNRYTAESGRSVAGVVNVVTKSGTNKLHGSAFGDLQNSALFAQDALNQVKEYKREQFGGSIGGPIKKDKLFFFGAYENKREPGSIAMGADPATELQTFATMTQKMPGGPYAVPIGSLPNPYIDHLLTVKLDYRINERQNLSVRYGRERWTQPNDQLGSPLFADASQSNTDANQFHDFSITHNLAISSNKANVIGVHFQDFANMILDAPGRTFTYPVAGGSTATNPNINFPGGANVGINVNVPQETLIRKYQFRDDFSWSRGKHSLKFGGNWIYLAKLGGYFYSGIGYTVVFWDNPTDITGNAAYPQGISTPGAVQEITYNAGSGSTAQPPAHSVGLYLQDDYKVSKNLTLNLGLRWDANPNFLQPQLGSSLTSSSRAIWALEQTLQANPTGAAAADGMAAIRYIVGDPSLLTKRTADWKEFQPRVGFAWDVSGTGKYVIRGGYGIARDQIFQNLTLWSIQQSQSSIYQTVIDQTSSVAPGKAGCSGPLCTFRFGIDPLPAPAANINDLAFGAVGRITNPHITDPWSQQMSIGFAWQFGRDYAFSADYIHILGTHEERVLNANPKISNICDPAFGGNPSDPRCVNGKGTRLMDAAFQAANTCGPASPPDTGSLCGAGRFAHIYEYSTNNRSLYDGINFQLKRRMNRHVQFQTSYVLSWSRAWGGSPVAAYMGSPQAVNPAQQFQPNEWGPTNNDERHRFVFSGVFALPLGIQLAPMFQAGSARPYSWLAGSDVDGDGRVIIDRVCVGSTAANPVTTPGCQMLAPNSLRGTPFVEMDLGTSKKFRLGERASLKFSVDLFNVFNRANYCNDYVETEGPNALANPQGYCGGPITPAGQSGYSAAAVPSFRTQFGLRFDF